MKAPPSSWLIKSDPETYSWSDLLRDRRTCWDGVRNFQARNNLRAMRRGDLVLFYHSGKDKQIVGVARVSSAAYADPTAGDGDWSAVDVAPAFALKVPVHLDQIKTSPELGQMALVKQSRLSVQPVAAAEIETIIRTGGKRSLPK